MSSNPGFIVDGSRCVKCGRCAEDCVANAIDMTENSPELTRPDDCIGCQHCLAVCPAAAVSIFGKRPEDSLPNANLPDYESVKRLIHGRRSIRHFRPEDVPAEVMRDILETAWYAPTGVNMEGVHLAALATKKAMDGFRAKVYDGIARELNRTGRPAGEFDETLREFVGEWKSDGTDNIFRTAPHLVIASTSPDTICAEADPMITLSYLDLYAQTRKVGTVWCGFAMLAIAACNDPAMWREAGVPEGCRPAYAMLMGLPAFSYPRGVQRQNRAAIRIIDEAY